MCSTSSHPSPQHSAQQIDDTKEHFKTVIKAGGIMDVVECYPWTGEQCTHSRRDKRWGLHKGGVVRTAEGPSIRYGLRAPRLFGKITLPMASLLPLIPQTTVVCAGWSGTTHLGASAATRLCCLKTVAA